MPNFTPQETRILSALADGKPHSVESLMKLLWDEESSRIALQVTITRIRKKIEPYDQYIHLISANQTRPESYIHVVPMTTKKSARTG